MVLMMPVPLDQLFPTEDFRLLVDLINDARGKSFGPPNAMPDTERKERLERLADFIRPTARQWGISI
jgi:hypothetical protein